MKSSRKRKRLSAVLILPLLSACSSADTVPIVPVSDPVDICEAWKQINKRKGDILSAETARTMVENNVGREALGCPYEPPPKPSKQRVAKARATS